MKKFEVIRRETGNIKLNDDERRQLRESLLSYMEKVPVVPRDENISLHRSSRSGWIVGVIAGILIGSAGVLVAASHALPGSFLYPIKTAVNDRVRVLFVNTTPSQNTASVIDSKLTSASTTLEQ